MSILYLMTNYSGMSIPITPCVVLDNDLKPDNASNFIDNKLNDHTDL